MTILCNKYGVYHFSHSFIYDNTPTTECYECVELWRRLHYFQHDQCLDDYRQTIENQGFDQKCQCYLTRKQLIKLGYDSVNHVGVSFDDNLDVRFTCLECLTESDKTCYIFHKENCSHY